MAASMPEAMLGFRSVGPYVSAVWKDAAANGRANHSSALSRHIVAHVCLIEWMPHFSSN
ncbi:hypothetical protein ACPOL_4512 [Acidisarcina polymorpha]|uniref:Uncharacterized protein n=1 Tax=Acidisarcina polymorpha TaxID=2211140 RepID=A0A2Z5G4M3_9BACT|nr:hypothetical protein ACPOL_4512 [Acidisarcina polymorpha]